MISGGEAGGTEPRPSCGDPARARAASVRYLRQEPPPPPPPDAADGDNTRDPIPPPTMTEPRDMQLEALRERVSRSEYDIDATAVAAAILARLAVVRPPSEHPG